MSQGDALGPFALYGGVSEWLIVLDLKSSGRTSLRPVGSNPTPSASASVSNFATGIVTLAAIFPLYNLYENRTYYAYNITIYYTAKEVYGRKEVAPEI